MPRFLRHQYGIFDERQAIGPARWPHHDLFFVHEGTVEMQFPELDRQISLDAGCGVLIWPRTAFQGQAMKGTVRASIQHFDLAKETSGLLARGRSQTHGFSPQAARPSLDLSRDVERAVALGRSEADGDEAVRHALLTLILTEGGYWQSPLPARGATRLDPETLRTWLHAHVAKNPGVPELAENSGLSPSRFRAVFLAEHGHNAGEFLRQYREAEARRLLVETRRSLKEIAAALGYADAVVFHRAFKSRVGQTPGEFRRRNRVSG